MIDGLLTTQNVTVGLFAVFVVKELVKLIPRYNGSAKEVELLGEIKTEIKTAANSTTLAANNAANASEQTTNSVNNVCKAQEKLVDVFILHDKQETRDHTEIRDKLEEIRRILNGGK